MGVFYKATGTPNTKAISQKQNSSAGILHVEVGIKGCHIVQILFYVKDEKVRFQFSFSKNSANDCPT